MTTERKRFESPPDLDDFDDAVLDRIHDERGIREGIRQKIDGRGQVDVPEVRTPPPIRTPPPSRTPPPPRRR